MTDIFYNSKKVWWYKVSTWKMKKFKVMIFARYTKSKTSDCKFLNANRVICSRKKNLKQSNDIRCYYRSETSDCTILKTRCQLGVFVPGKLALEVVLQGFVHPSTSKKKNRLKLFQIFKNHRIYQNHTRYDRALTSIKKFKKKKNTVTHLNKNKWLPLSSFT